MIDSLLSIVAPHHCCGCGFEGTILCENCKYDIISEPFSACVACGVGMVGATGLCKGCHVPYDRAWCVSVRQDYLKRLISDFKFMNAKAAYEPLADLLHEYLPELPASTRIVPVPTISSHIRQRGYDHTLLISRRLARLRGLPVDTSLQRATNTMQQGAGRRQRTEQAKKAFACSTPLDPDVIYLLVDDVVTTGATVKFAAQTLVDAGARAVWVASISRQPLD